MSASASLGIGTMQLADDANISITDVARIPGVEALWAETLGDPRICVALVDGPVDCSHPTLAGARLAWTGMAAKKLSRGLALQHGTQVASIIFGQHDGHIKGIAPHCRGLIVPIFSDRPDGSLASYSQLGLAQAIALAVQAGAHIINISLGQYSLTGDAQPLLVKVVSDCAARGVLVVAAAGNEGRDGLSIPAALPSVLAVGAMDSRGFPFAFSNWGEKYRTQGILAPGGNIPTADIGGGTNISSGTSYATPIVSGIAALLASFQLQHGLKPNLHVIREAILRSALGCNVLPVPDCRRLLAGRLNVNGAISLIFTGVNAVSNLNESHEKEQFAIDAGNSGKFSPWGSVPSMRAKEALGNELCFTGETSNFPARFPPSQNTSLTDSSTACGCDSSGPVQWVFSLGKLGYDFGTEARRDSIRQHMKQPALGVDPSPYDPVQLLGYLEGNPWDAAAIIWTLNLDATPVYAIKACGAFAGDVYLRLREFLRDQIERAVERISIPGSIVGNVRLMNGQMVPVIQPDLRGMYSWKTETLIDAVCSQPKSAIGEDLQEDRGEQGEYHKCKDRVGNFFVRAYEELRNLGIAPQDRAINYAATNALLVAQVFKEAIKEGLVLGNFVVERSPVCRPESDCWDVKLTFFNPSKIFEQASKVYLFTVDVGDVVPVMVGMVRSWFVYVRP